jgi:hypothetical protein
MKVLIRNGKVCFENVIEASDILVENGKIAALGSLPDAIPSAKVIDAKGLFVLPGFIDIHTHLDDQIGRFYLADTYQTGTQVAVQNGVTMIYTFITQGRQERLSEAIANAKAKAAGHCYCDYLWHLTPTVFDEDGHREIEKAIQSGFRSIKLYTTYKKAGIFSDYKQIEEVVKRYAPLDAQFLVHCEDEDILSWADAGRLDLSRPFTHSLMRKCWRNDAYAKVTGKAKFTDDLKFANVLHAAPAYSDFVHARIVSIDTSAARKFRRVRVLTAKDVPGVNRFGQIIRDYRIFADDKIRYHGDVVAIVVAETREIAIHAAQLVKVNADAAARRA